MKSELNTIQKPNTLKKIIKPLNQKKNSIITESILKKQKSKTNLILNDNSQLSFLNAQKLASPKNTNFPSSMISPKTQGNEEFFKSEKSEFKKTGITNAKIKKAGISKHEPIKKQFLPIMKSPKNTRINTVQSEIYLNSQRDQSINFNEQSHLTIDLETSILKTEHDIDEIVEDNLVLNQSSIHNISQIQGSKIQELSKTSKEQSEQITRLKQKNEELQRKLQKLKQSQEQNRKKLKERISNFNEEGQQIKAIKQRVVQLQKQIAILQNENYQLKNSTQVSLQFNSIENKLKSEIIVDQKKISALQHALRVLSVQILPNKQHTDPTSKQQMVDESVMTSFDDSICDNVLSFINGSSSGNMEESILSNDKIKDSQVESLNVIPSLQIQTIKNSYEEKYKDKILSLESFYKQGIKDIENRYRLLVSQTANIVKSQQKEMFSLQNKIDNLYEKLEECTCSSTKRNPNMGTDEEKLKHMMQINQYRQKLSKKDEELKHYRQQVHVKQIQCKKVLSQLDIERIKFNLNSQISTVNKQMLEHAQKEQLQLLFEELKLQKQRNAKLLNQNQKKEELIKKMTALHTTTTAGNKKLRK